MGTRRLTIMIVPHSHRRIREVTVTDRALVVGASILVAAVILTLTYAIGFHIRTSQAKAVERLKAENVQLASRLQDMSSGVVELKTEVGDLVRKEEMLRVMANLPEVDSDVRMVGLGSLEADEDLFSTEDVVTEAGRLGMEVHADIQSLLNQAKFQKESFKQIERALANNIEFRDHLPSIPPCNLAHVYLSSHFGYRADPYTGRRRIHKGIDLAGRTGTQVMATADGVVADVAWGGYSGLVVQINHMFGYSTVYGHLSKALVRKGQKVTRGQPIAQLGNTGRSTGPHLHYSVFYNGRAVDPANFFYVN
jgi:murein DD-endopeptidase MepM/ murein hydrolase activator NlpD